MKSYSITDIGRKRQSNQDFLFCSDEPVGNLPDLYIVADGMGGHKAGDFASRFSVEGMVKGVRSDPGREPQDVLGRTLRHVNSSLYAESMKSTALYGCGTTIVMAVVDPSEDHSLYVANVGDSRLYILGDSIRQITVDHSLVEEMVKAGSLTRERARTHPDKNVITRAVGVENYIDVDFFRTKLQPGELLLLCTDGLTNMVEDGDILSIVRDHGTLEEKAKALIERANANGGLDNISVTLVDAFS